MLWLLKVSGRVRTQLHAMLEERALFHFRKLTYVYRVSQSLRVSAYSPWERQACWLVPFGRVGHILPIEVAPQVLLLISGIFEASRAEAKDYTLNILRQCLRIGEGSLSSITTRKSRTCTTSYLSCKFSGGSSKTFHTPSLTLLASHASGGYPDEDMSNPSSWAEGGKLLARSRSQILREE